MILSATIANVAVPSVMGAYGIGQDRAQWMATAFIATMVASQLVSAWFANALGVRTAFIVINAVFLAGTAITIFTPNFDVLILGRVLQGFSAGVMQPMVMALIFKMFRPEKRGTAMGIYGMGIQIAPMLGPMFGGLMIDAYGWREIFIVPVPICLMSLVLGMMCLPSKEDTAHQPKFDWPGYLLLCTALVLLLAAGANGQRYGWSSDTIVLMFTGGIGAAAWFVALQLRSAEPLLDFSLFKNAQFASAVMVSFVFGIGNFASNYLIPVYVQEVQGFSASLSGTMLVPAGLLVIFGSPIFGRLSDVFPAHLMVMIGLLLFAFGNFLMSGSDVNTSFLTFVGFIVVARSGMALIMPAMSIAALRALTPEQLNKGSGTVNFCRQLGGAFGITSVVVFMGHRTQFHAEAFTATQTSSNSVCRELLAQVETLLQQAGLPEATQAPVALEYLGQIVAAQASTLGYQDGFSIIMVVFLMALVPAWILGRRSAR